MIQIINGERFWAQETDTPTCEGCVFRVKLNCGAHCDGANMVYKTLVVLRRTSILEVPCKDGYRWVNGWTLTSPRGNEYVAMPLAEATALAKQGFPGCKVEISYAESR